VLDAAAGDYDPKGCCDILGSEFGPGAKGGDVDVVRLSCSTPAIP